MECALLLLSTSFNSCVELLSVSLGLDTEFYEILQLKKMKTDQLPGKAYSPVKLNIINSIQIIKHLNTPTLTINNVRNVEQMYVSDRRDLASDPTKCIYSW